MAETEAETIKKEGEKEMKEKPVEQRASKS
jgi:hypothetical protein